MLESSTSIQRESGVTVWYDGDCPLCRREIAVMRKLDSRGAIAFVNIGKSGSEQCPINREDMLARFHASEDGKLLSGAAAFAAMWRAIPIMKPLGWTARNKTVLALLERLYLVFLKFRPKLQSLLR